MYTCLECGCEFDNPAKLTETHSLCNPPYEKIYVCPSCKSTSFKEKTIKHCRCCGAKLILDNSDYCSDICKAKGEKLRLKEIEHKKLLSNSPIYSLVREVDDYNQKNNTKLSYGQFVAFVKSKKKNKKNAKKQKEIS